MSYFQTDTKTIDFLSAEKINELYNKGYLFTRVAKGNFYQTRSLRINLNSFELSSENRRIINKNLNLNISKHAIPLDDYSWKIHSYGKEFYYKKFGDGTMSASKIKEMFLNTEKSNMNGAFIYQSSDNLTDNPNKWDLGIGSLENIVGISLIYSNTDILHYAYPFYDLEIPKEQSLGLAMMTKAIIWAKEQNMEYVYLGSVTSTQAHYKLQFKGLEWFDTDSGQWVQDLSRLKVITNN
jgi:arginyl-tRNA--protein-N-Asp/Glu arginylyltransferase